MPEGLVFMSILTAGLLAYPSSASVAADLKSVAARLESAATAQELDSIVAEAEGARQKTTAKPIDLLQEKSSSELVKAHACYLLEGLGDLSAVDSLIQNIDVGFRSPGFDEHRIYPIDPWPCSGALVRLGNAIRDRVVRLIATTESACKRDLGLNVLMSVASADGAGAASQAEEVEGILRNAMPRAGQLESQRLQAALGSVANRSWSPLHCPVKEPEPEERHEKVPHFPGGDLDIAAVRLSLAKSREEMEGIVFDIDDQRRSLLSSLDAVIRQSRVTSVKARACFLLGQFHVWLGDQQLVENVDLEWAGGRERYPCEEALIKGGRGGDRSVMSYLARTDDLAQGGHLVHVMISWYGGARVAARLKEAMGKAEGESTKRLAEALKIAQAPAAKR
jgi:hypothetical protein